MLTKHAADFARFAAERGLVLNAGKTQLMWVGEKSSQNISVQVDGINVVPEKSIELLGVKIDNKLSFARCYVFLARIF